MSALNDLYQLRTVGTVLGLPQSNVYHYQCTGPLDAVPNAGQLITGFVSDVVPPLLLIMSLKAEIDEIHAFNVDDTTDFDDEISGGIGAVTGDCLPAVMAWKFRIKRLTRDSRNGSKAIAGVPEAGQVDGVVDTSFNTLVANAAAALGQDIVVAGVTYSPVLFRKPSPGLPVGVVFRTNGAEYIRIAPQVNRAADR